METKQPNGASINTQNKVTEKSETNLAVEVPTSSNATTSPPSPLNSTPSPSNAQTDSKKSYKLALTKELPMATTNDKTVESKPLVEQATEQAAVDASKQKEVNNIPRKPTSPAASSQPPPQPWKRNPPINNKKKKKEDEENLTDLQAWPSLEEVKTEPAKDKKKETKKEEADSNGTDTQTDTTENATSPKEAATQEHTNNKKKGVNWVPLEIEAPRQHSGRGRGGSRGRGASSSQNPNNPMNRSSWRSQAPNPNPRGARRGRGGYNGGRTYYPPSTPVYFPPPLDPENLKQTLLKQVEYYFSIENLCKDVYLRQQMDEEGWIPIAVIAAFNRVKTLTADIQQLTEIVQSSTFLEYKDEKLRRKEDWKFWVLPTKQEQNPSPTTSPKSDK